MPAQPISGDGHRYCATNPTRGFDYSLFRRAVDCHKKPGLIVGTLALLMLVFPASLFAAPPTTKGESKLKSIQLCNGADRSSPDQQIKGCTVLIESGKDTGLILAIAHTNRGNAYTAKGDYDLAIGDFDLAVKLNPAFSKPFNSRGVALFKKGDFERAIQDFDAAIKLQPDYAKAFANRAEVNQKIHKYQQAARDYDEAIRLSPNLETDAAGPGRFWGNFNRRSRTATRPSKCGPTMPRLSTRAV